MTAEKSRHPAAPTPRTSRETSPLPSSDDRIRELCEKFGSAKINVPSTNTAVKTPVRAKASEPHSDTMSRRGWKKRLLVLALVTCAGVGLAVWLGPGSAHEPLHNGKPIRYWVDQACSRPNEFEAQREVRNIGVQAIPCLISKLKYRETWVDRSLLEIRDRLPPPLSRLLPAPSTGPFERSCAAECLAMFGPDAKPAVRALAKLVNVNNTNGLDADRAIAALNAIGPEARDALPALRRAMTNQRPFLQVAAARAVWAIHRETNLVLHVFTNVISASADDGAVACAALGLFQLGPAAAPAVPVLLQALRNPKLSAGARANAAVAFGAVGVNNPTVIATLLEGTRDSDAGVRTTCARSLWQLDKQFAPVAVPIIVDWIVEWNKQKPQFKQEFTRLIVAWNKQKSQLAEEFERHSESGNLDPATAIPALTELLKRGSPEEQQVADEALKLIQSEENYGDAKP
jgi:HEAT repeat protein